MHILSGLNGAINKRFGFSGIPLYCENGVLFHMEGPVLKSATLWRPETVENEEVRFYFENSQTAFIAMVTQRLLLNYPRQIMYAGVFLAVYLGDSLFTRRGKTVQYYQRLFLGFGRIYLVGLAAFHR